MIGTRSVHALIVVAFVTGSLALAGARSTSAASASKVLRIDHVADGDTVDLTNGARVRLVQIDTPEVYFHPECYGEQASALTKRLLPPGTAVLLTREPATDSVDSYGRLLRYVIRRHDGLDINVRLVTAGAAAPYFYAGRRGRYAARLARLALRARTHHLGLWGNCPGTPYDPYKGVSTGPPR
ncbi:MAG TPA: thermonuclease family protein [Gaiellaceae bacterium]|nr:thermonuclease family protein [Gaiellaceae bacterium]